MDSVSVTQIFTPTTPAILTFVERNEATSRRIAQALITPGMQIILYGCSGTGKTTLLRNKLEQISDGIEIICRCTASTTYHEILASAFAKVKATFIAQENVARPGTEVSIGGSYAGTGANVSVRGGGQPTTVAAPVSAPPVTVELLGEYLGEAGATLVLEDFHKLATDDKKHMAQAMKLFMDLAADYPKLRMILLGARETAREILTLDDEMRNRVAEIGVEAMTPSELKEIIAKGSELLNIAFQESVVNRIVEFCCGMPAVAHQLALSACLDAGVNSRVNQLAPLQLPPSHVDTAMHYYVEDQAPNFRDTFELAMRQERKSKFDNYGNIMKVLCRYPAGITRPAILAMIRRRIPGYPAPNLTRCLKRLVSSKGELIAYDRASNIYRFRDPKACAYAAMRMALRKWADYCVTQATFDQDGVLTTVALLRDEGKTVADTQNWNRAEVVDALLKGTTFVTVTRRREGWLKGNAVNLVHVLGSPYVRTDVSQIPKDDLGGVPSQQ